MLSRLVAKSRSFVIFMLIFGAVMGCIGVYCLATYVNLSLFIAILGSVGFVAARFQFNFLESLLVIGIIIVFAAVVFPINPWIETIPGAITGLFSAMAVLDLMDAPNKRASEFEVEKNDTHPKENIQ
jgi:hypothetical protein